LGEECRIKSKAGWKREAGLWRHGLEGDFLPAYGLVTSFFSYFKQFMPEAWKTIGEGISLDLKPRAWHPPGKFLSQMTKKRRHLKQSTFSGFMSQEKAWAQRASEIEPNKKTDRRIRP
jgi:hypothetical protein